MKTTTFLILLATSLSLRSQLAADGGEDGAASSRLSLAEVTRPVWRIIRRSKKRRTAGRPQFNAIRQANAWDDPRIAGESRVRRYVDVPPNAFMDQTLAIEQLIPITGKNLVRGRVAAAEALSAFEEVAAHSARCDREGAHYLLPTGECL